MAKVQLTNSVYQINGRDFPNINYTITREFLGINSGTGSVWIVYQNGMQENIVYSTETTTTATLTNVANLTATTLIGYPFKGIKTATPFAIPKDLDVNITETSDGKARIIIDNIEQTLIITQESYAAVIAALSDSSSTSAVWGSITGTLSNQTDLQAALDAKISAGVDNEVQTSDGAGGFVASKLFVDENTANITLGDASLVGSERKIITAGSSTNINLNISSKGTNGIIQLTTENVDIGDSTTDNDVRYIRAQGMLSTVSLQLRPKGASGQHSVSINGDFSVITQNNVIAINPGIRFTKTTSTNGLTFIFKAPNGFNGTTADKEAENLLLVGGTPFAGSNLDGSDIFIRGGNNDGTGTPGSVRIQTNIGTDIIQVDSVGIGFFGGTPVAQQTGYTTFTNLATDRTLDADATTTEELADVLGTLIEDLKTLGIISA